jgi:DNA-binding transcriptional MerR regulator
MVDSHEVLKKTGIKNIKTLTRWHQAGIIPAPAIGRSRSSRGVTGYFPDWVVPRIQKIRALQREGHSLKSATEYLDSLEAREKDGPVGMVTAKQILAATGLKNAHTLTRWHKHHGIIPHPTIGVSSSGRGKCAYWPDWVLDRCRRIVELQKQGHTLASALRLVDREERTVTAFSDESGWCAAMGDVGSECFVGNGKTISEALHNLADALAGPNSDT